MPEGTQPERTMLEALLRTALDEVKGLPDKDAQTIQLYIQAAVDVMGRRKASLPSFDKSTH